MSGQRKALLSIIGTLSIFLLIGCTAPETATPTLPPPTEEPIPVQPTATPTATAIPPTPTAEGISYFQDTDFPLGEFRFAAYKVVFREDGTATWSGSGWSLKDIYGINGNLFAEMVYFYGDNQPQVPTTYYWEFDGNELSFTPFGEDLRSHRKLVLEKIYTYIGPSIDRSQDSIEVEEFPTGRFISEDGVRAFEFDEDGLWRFFDGDLENPIYSGKYVTYASSNGLYYTEMTHDNPNEPQIPVTYKWTFDGENLTFELWGDEYIEYRGSMYNGQTYIWVGE